MYNALGISCGARCIYKQRNVVAVGFDVLGYRLCTHSLADKGFVDDDGSLTVVFDVIHTVLRVLGQKRSIAAAGPEGADLGSYIFYAAWQ